MLAVCVLLITGQSSAMNNPNSSIAINSQAIFDYISKYIGVLYKLGYKQGYETGFLDGNKQKQNKQNSNTTTTKMNTIKAAIKNTELLFSTEKTLQALIKKKMKFPKIDNLYNHKNAHKKLQYSINKPLGSKTVLFDDLMGYFT